jgi:hypothetical protein
VIKLGKEKTDLLNPHLADTNGSLVAGQPLYAARHKFFSDLLEASLIGIWIEIILNCYFFSPYVRGKEREARRVDRNM